LGSAGKEIENGKLAISLSVETFALQVLSPARLTAMNIPRDVGAGKLRGLDELTTLAVFTS
jgi:hypothetical protein